MLLSKSGPPPQKKDNSSLPPPTQVPGPAPLRWPPATTQYTDIIDVQREELERERIGAVLEECITSTYVIQPQLGRAVYLEHAFRNTRAHPLNVTLSWKCPELKYVHARDCVNHIHVHVWNNSFKLHQFYYQSKKMRFLRWLVIF